MSRDWPEPQETGTYAERWDRADDMPIPDADTPFWIDQAYHARWITRGQRAQLMEPIIAWRTLHPSDPQPTTTCQGYGPA